MPESHTTRIAVVGAGAFGRNHLRVWHQLESAGAPVHLAALVEPDPASAAEFSIQYALPMFSSVEALLQADQSFDAASVAVPTSLHAEVASQLLSAGVDVLLEKPIAASLQQAEQLIALAQHHNRILQIGHLERFNPAVQAVRPIVRQPLFFEVHRLSVFTPRSLDVDVVLDLMIHDLDVVLSFVQSPIRELHAVGLPVLSSKVDIANVRIEFESGCVANFTASRVSTERVRKMRFFQPHQYISIDYARRDVLCIDVAPETAPFAQQTVAQSQPDNFQIAAQQHPTPEFTMRKLQVPPGEPLQLELEAFLHSVRTRTAPQVSAQDGLTALTVAIDILEAIDAHRTRTGLA